MKKLLTVSAFVMAAFLIHVAGNDTAKAMSEKSSVAILSVRDTVPGKDTTRKDSLQYGAMNLSTFDTTLPQKDTAKKDTMFSSAVAYRLVGDTIPKGDTTKKDTSFQTLAFNR